MSTSPQEHAFLKRLNDHRGILFKVTGAYCRDAADREDLAQDIIANLWRSYATFDERRNFSTWMYRIAVNVAISFYRRQARYRRSVSTVDDTVLYAVPDMPADPPDPNVERLHELIRGLDEFNRALMLLYLDDYPQSAIAEILGLSETNVATKIARIKEKLKKEQAKDAV